MNADIQKAMALPDVKAQLELQGLQAAGGSPADFDAFIRCGNRQVGESDQSRRRPARRHLSDYLSASGLTTLIGLPAANARIWSKTC